MKKIVLAQPRGFCAGVARAVDTIDELLQSVRETVYVRKEIVHNRSVIEQFQARGAVFVDDVEQVPEGAVLVYSAHGVSPAVRKDSELRKLRTVDTTCPLVTKVHREVVAFAASGYHVVLIGHRAHEEVEGTMGHASGVTLVQNEAEARCVPLDPELPLAVVSQTTLAASEVQRIIAILRERFPDIALPRRSDICYATENRQAAIRSLIDVCQGVIVVGSQNSSNSRSLRDVVTSSGVSAILIDDPRTLEAGWLAGITTLGITAGASSPETLVEAVIDEVQRLDPAFSRVETIGRPEPSIVFNRPRELESVVRRRAYEE